MKIYDFTQAPNPRRVRIFLAEKGIEVPYEQVNILKRENRSEAFLKKNPTGGIPVLELDDGSHIAESVAICRYFEELHPTPPLFGEAAKERAETEMWNRRIELGLLVPVGMVWIHGSPLTAPLGRHLPECAEQYRKVVVKYLSFLDRVLADREFIAGVRYSIADISALCTIDFATTLVGLPTDPDARHLARWHAAVANRPSARA